MSPLRWTLKSSRRLADALVEMGHKVSHMTVYALLGDLGYSMQATAKTVEGAQHPDRNAQFEHINAAAKAFLAAGQPVISVDCKRKELVGDVPGYKNAGREWQPDAIVDKEPEPVAEVAEVAQLQLLTRIRSRAPVGRVDPHNAGDPPKRRTPRAGEPARGVL